QGEKGLRRRRRQRAHHQHRPGRRQEKRRILSWSNHASSAATQLGVFFRIRPEPKHVAVRVSDLHFAGPRKVLWWLENLSAALFVLFVQRLDIIDTEPHPGSGMPLVTFGQVDVRPIPSDARKVVATPLGVAETQSVDIVAEAPLHIGDAQYRIGVLELRPYGLWTRHEVL